MRTYSVIPFVLVTLAGGEISRGQDKPVRNTVVGTWVVNKVKEAKNWNLAEPGGLPKVGTLYKFRKNGTCLYNDKEVKYKFSNEDRELIVTWEKEIVVITYDVKFRTVARKEQMILRWTRFGEQFEVLFDSD